MATLISKETLEQVCCAVNRRNWGIDEYKQNWNKLREFRRNCELCDVVIKCNNETHHAHKVILSLVSPYFRALFTSPLSVLASGEQGVDLSLYSEGTVTLLLDFIYGEFQMDVDVDLPDLLQLAEFLQYDTLVSSLVDCIRNCIDKTNCYSWFNIGKTSGVETLVHLSKSCMLSNYDYLLACYVEDSQSLNDINEIVITKDAFFEKKVALCSAGDEKHVIDCSFSHIKLRRDGMCQPLTQWNSSYHIYFVFKNQLMLVSTYDVHASDDVFHADYFEKNTKIVIHAYDHCKRCYDKLYAIEPCSLVSKVHFENIYNAADPDVNHPFSIYTFVYDGKHSLYIILCNYELYCIFKYDLRSGTFAANWIIMKSTLYGGKIKLLESHELGMILIDSCVSVYDIENFNFTKEEGGYHTANELDILFGWTMEHQVINWNAVSLNREVYLFEFVDKKRELMVHHLNVKKKSWNIVCSFHFHCLLQVRQIFVCNSELYADLSPEVSSSLIRVDLGKKSYQLVDLHLPQNPRFFVLPSYLLL